VSHGSYYDVSRFMESETLIAVFYNSLPLDRILNQTNPIDNVTPCFFKIILILSSRLLLELTRLVSF
jgi:hypothetical protein